jgi:hypothetical protein
LVADFETNQPSGVETVSLIDRELLVAVALGQLRQGDQENLTLSFREG